ncbi:hypothetical protein EVAR_58472_1 [Eumeta japonica]|uniref:Uncharacterized protein n=1 Tax=Eumeta variegata TaxID=151549 RepID=A0A4C1YKU9_EUMVA|nr:hypothetical protein EVAR_58472_1 [Eumeta japonica]
MNIFIKSTNAFDVRNQRFCEINIENSTQKLKAMYEGLRLNFFGVLSWAAKVARNLYEVFSAPHEKPSHGASNPWSQLEKFSSAAVINSANNMAYPLQLQLTKYGVRVPVAAPFLSPHSIRHQLTLPFIDPLPLSSDIPIQEDGNALVTPGDASGFTSVYELG